jgi:hypothetical protein
MARTHIKTDEREELEHLQRLLLSLQAHGLGQTGPCAELFAAGRMIKAIEDRLNPPPSVDLVAEAKELIARFGTAPWVTDALEEVD